MSFTWFGENMVLFGSMPWCAGLCYTYTDAEANHIVRGFVLRALCLALLSSAVVMVHRIVPSLHQLGGSEQRRKNVVYLISCPGVWVCAAHTPWTLSHSIM